MPVAGRLSVEVDSGGSVVFWHQASDLIPEQRCAGVSVLHAPPPRPPALPGRQTSPAAPCGAQA